MCIQNNKIVPPQGDIIAYKLLGQKDGKFVAPFRGDPYEVGETYVNDVKEWIKCGSDPKRVVMYFDRYVIAEITIHNEAEGDVYIGTFISCWVGEVDSYAAKKITINKIIQ